MDRIQRWKGMKPFAYVQSIWRWGLVPIGVRFSPTHKMGTDFWAFWISVGPNDGFVMGYSDFLKSECMRWIMSPKGSSLGCAGMVSSHIKWMAHHFSLERSIIVVSDAWKVQKSCEMGLSWVLFLVFLNYNVWSNPSPIKKIWPLRILNRQINVNDGWEIKMKRTNNKSSTTDGFIQLKNLMVSSSSHVVRFQKFRIIQ